MQPGIKQLSDFGTTPDGQTVQRWQLDNGRGLIMEVLNLGGIVTRLSVPDRHGQSVNICLAPADVATIFRPGWPYLGALIGRVANRVANAQFTLNGQTYRLAVNNPPHSLHGGRIGYDRRFWEVTPFHSPEGPAIRLTLTDLDGTEQYPGTVHVEVTYTLTILGTWRITYSATTDQITPINLTQHAYFNLKDGGRSPITDHLLQMPCTHYTPTDASLIPTGEICPVAGSAHDFTQPKPLGRDFNRLESDPVGYDCNYVIPGPSGTLRWAASVTEPVSGRSMQVYTTQPGVQLYTGNFLDGSLLGIDGFAYQQHAGFCLETQHYPDALHHPEFPSILLHPGRPYYHTTEYRFSV